MVAQALRRLSPYDLQSAIARAGLNGWASICEEAAASLAPQAAPPSMDVDPVSLGSSGTGSPEARRHALRLAKEATNGWACYAKRKIELDEIARLHSAIAKAESQASPAAPAPSPALEMICRECGHIADVTPMFNPPALPAAPSPEPEKGQP